MGKASRRSEKYLALVLLVLSLILSDVKVLGGREVTENKSRVVIELFGIRTADSPKDRAQMAGLSVWGLGSNPFSRKALSKL